MQDFKRERQHKEGDLARSEYPAYPMWLSTRDMARLAYLMLRRGRWRDRQLIPENWVKRCTSIVTPRTRLNPGYAREWPFGYGYLWWVWDEPAAIGPFQGAYTAWGAFGQYITVLPKLDMVIAHKTIPVNREVTLTDYLRLLDCIVGRTSASEEILPVLWRKSEEEAFALGERSKTQSAGHRLEESDLYAAGVALLRRGQLRQSEQALRLNARLYPDSVRTLLALSRVQAAEGETIRARESAQRALRLRPQSGPAKLQLARLGAPVEGHTGIDLPLDRLRLLTGVYHSAERRYVVDTQERHLRIRAYRENDLDDAWEVFAEENGQFFAPVDGTTIRFRIGPTGAAETIEGIQGKETWLARR